MRRAIEEAHPGLYRYHSRDSVSRWFDAAEARLTHPMTELQFRRAVEPAVDRIGCGHTDLYGSKAYVKYRKKHPQRPFPVDAFVVANKLYINKIAGVDTTHLRGSELLTINGRPTGTLLSQLYQYISSDGYNQTFKPFVLNNGMLHAYYALAIGPDSTTQQFTLRDSTGKIQSLTFLSLPQAKPIKTNIDSVAKEVIPASRPRKPKPHLPEAKEEELRTLTFPVRDSSVAVLKVKSFSGGGQRAFFRRSFRAIARHKTVENLVVDVRGNLGGNSTTSIRLASYLIDKPFRAYSQVDAPVRQVSFNRYLGWKFMRFWIRNFFTYKTPEGTFRRKGVTGLTKPMAKNGFRGQVFVLTNGGTFSAASIFASLVKHNAARVTVVGRETGGGAYGCNAFTSPYMTLPETGVQLRLPLYKIVLAIPGTDQGRGVIPDVPVAYTASDILNARDLDIEKVYELVREK